MLPVRRAYDLYLIALDLARPDIFAKRSLVPFCRWRDTKNEFILCAILRTFLVTIKMRTPEGMRILYRFKKRNYYSESAACAAASLAIGTLKGEQDT